MSLAAWETEDGDVVVWGTHDLEVATLVIKNAVHAGMIIMDPFGDEDDRQYEVEFWEWINAGPRTIRWVHQDLINEEIWPQWLVLREEKELTRPIMVFCR